MSNSFTENSKQLMPCEGCGHSISRSAASCPNCGHPVKAGIVSTFEQIQKVGGFVSIVISILVLGLQATVLKMIGVANAGPQAGEVTLTTVFLQTAPFTIAVTLIIIVLIKDKSTRQFSEVIGISCVILLGSVWLNSWLTGKGSLGSVLGNPFAIIFKTLSLYWLLYGASLFFSSIILGAFLAWTVTKLWPNKDS